MEQNRKKQAGIVITAITKLLKEFNFGLEIYKKYMKRISCEKILFKKSRTSQGLSKLQW